MCGENSEEAGDGGVDRRKTACDGQSAVWQIAEKELEFPRQNTYNPRLWRACSMDEVVKVELTEQQSADIKKQIGFELREIYITKRSLNKLRVFRLRLSEAQQGLLAEKLGQQVRELTVTRSVATRIL
jgi:hypothetical protein